MGKMKTCLLRVTGGCPDVTVFLKKSGFCYYRALPSQISLYANAEGRIVRSKV